MSTMRISRSFSTLLTRLHTCQYRWRFIRSAESSLIEDPGVRFLDSTCSYHLLIFRSLRQSTWTSIREGQGFTKEIFISTPRESIGLPPSQWENILKNDRRNSGGTLWQKETKNAPNPIKGRGGPTRVTYLHICVCIYIYTSGEHCFFRYVGG